MKRQLEEAIAIIMAIIDRSRYYPGDNYAPQAPDFNYRDTI
jgi:hypothetical protein